MKNDLALPPSIMDLRYAYIIVKLSIRKTWL